MLQIPEEHIGIYYFTWNYKSIQQMFSFKLDSLKNISTMKTYMLFKNIQNVYQVFFCLSSSKNETISLSWRDIWNVDLDSF